VNADHDERAILTLHLPLPFEVVIDVGRAIERRYPDARTRTAGETLVFFTPGGAT
jgi:hypothetical protein